MAHRKKNRERESSVAEKDRERLILYMSCLSLYLQLCCRQCSNDLFHESFWIIQSWRAIQSGCQLPLHGSFSHCQHCAMWINFQYSCHIHRALLRYCVPFENQKLSQKHLALCRTNYYSGHWIQHSKDFGNSGRYRREQGKNSKFLLSQIDLHILLESL